VAQSLKVWSVNLGRCVGKIKDEEPQTVKWLKSLSAPGAVLPDVVFFQDFRISMLQYLVPIFPHFHFVPMTNHKIWGQREYVGICAGVRPPLQIGSIDVECTQGDGTLRDLDGVGDNNDRWTDAVLADRRVLETELRVMLGLTVYVPDGPEGALPFRFWTHHGAWVRGGETSEEQLQSTDLVCGYLVGDADFNDGLVFVADCNLDKHGKVFAKYLEAGARDHHPDGVSTTLASTHPGAKFGAKPDRVMDFPDEEGNRPYEVSNVEFDAAPGSDHLLMKAVVSKK